MCLLALYFQEINGYPLVVAANRDEFFARPSAPPQFLRENPVIYGGKDLQAGGTWLGVNEHGLLVGILNRRSGSGEEANSRSRGLLCLDLLGARNPAQVCGELQRHERFGYRPFNLVFANSESAYVAYNDGRSIFCLKLEKGLHVLSNTFVYASRSEKLGHAYQLFARAAASLGQDFDHHRGVQVLQTALSDHTRGDGNDPKQAVCVHLPLYGTVSSSLVCYSQTDRRFYTYYSSGPPCQNLYEEGRSIAVP